MTSILVLGAVTSLIGFAVGYVTATVQTHVRERDQARARLDEFRKGQQA